MGEISPVIESLLRVKEDNRLKDLYAIILKRDVLTDAELAVAATETAFSKLSQLILRVDEQDTVKLGLHLKIAMLASLIIRRLCYQNPPGQQLARNFKLIQMVESIVRKSLSAANDSDLMETEFSQYKAAFMAFSESLLVMVNSPLNLENLQLIAPFSDYYLHHIVNWQVGKSWPLLDRLVELYKAAVSNDGVCPLKWSNVFAKMLEDEVKLQQEPSSLDFQLLYRRFQVISLFPESLDDVENETKETLVRRFMCLLDNTRDYDSHRFAVFSFARRILPHLVPHSEQQVCKIIPQCYEFNDDDEDKLTDESDDDEEEEEEEEEEGDNDKQLERINSLSAFLWTSLEGLNNKKVPVPRTTEPPIPPTAKKHRTSYDKLLQPPYCDILIKVGRKMFHDAQPKSPTFS